jgi:hypothetical protein
MCQLSKVPSIDIMLNMMKFGVGEQFLNAATLLTYHSHGKKTFFVQHCQNFLFSLAF